MKQDTLCICSYLFASSLLFIFSFRLEQPKQIYAQPNTIYVACLLAIPIIIKQTAAKNQIFDTLLFTKPPLIPSFIN